MTRFVNQRPVPQDLADGSFVPPGETVELTAAQQKEPHNQRLIDEGVLEPKTPKAKPDKEGDD